MAKVRRPVVDYLVYLAVRTFVCVIQAMPMTWAFGIADLLAKLAYRFDKRHRVVATENLSHAFPERTPKQIDQLVRGCFSHFARVVIEMVLLPRKFHVNSWRKYGGMIRSEPVVGGLLDDRPLLIVTAHFGNWELAGYAMGVFGFRSYAIARVLDNVHLERFLKQFRQATGQTVIAKKDDFDRLTAVLQAGGNVATLADQDAGPRGVFIDFFGRKASAHKAVAIMAMEFDARMAVLGVARVSHKFEYRIVCTDSIDPRDYADRPDAVKAITQRYHQALEKLIRQYPEQYFWLHRRWKTRPKSEQKGQATATA